VATRGTWVVIEEIAISGPIIGGEFIVPINVVDTGKEMPTDPGVFTALMARAGEASTLGAFALKRSFSLALLYNDIDLFTDLASDSSKVIT
jgi:hypothetical protein